MAADERDADAEHHRLRHGEHEVGEAHRVGQRLHEVGGRYVHGDVGREHASGQGAQRGPDGDERHGDGECHGARHHQPEAVRDAHDAHGIQFLGDPHDADLRRDGRTGPPRHEDGREHGAQFPDQRDAQDVDDEGLGAELPQLQAHEVGQHHADQEAHDGRDGQGRGAHAVEVARDVAPGRAARCAQGTAEVDDQLPHQFQQMPAVAERVQHLHAEAVHFLDEAPGRNGRPVDDGEFGHAIEHVALGVVERDPFGPDAPPVVPEQLRADVVQPIDAAQIPPQAGVRRVLRELRGHLAPGAPRAQVRRAPAPVQRGDWPFGRVGAFDAGRAVAHGQGRTEAGAGKKWRESTGKGTPQKRQPDVSGARNGGRVSAKPVRMAEAGV